MAIPDPISGLRKRGELQGQAEPTPKYNSDETKFTIAGGKGGSPSFHGIIDEVRISNVARYTKDFTPKKRFENDENTLALYHFDQASGTVLKD